MAVLRADEIKAHDCKTATALQRKEWGCNEPVPDGFEWIFMGVKIDRCVQYYVKRAHIWINFIIEMHNWRDKGVTSFPGCWAEQPNFIVEAMNFMDCLVAVKTAPPKMKTSPKGKK